MHNPSNATPARPESTAGQSTTEPRTTDPNSTRHAPAAFTRRDQRAAERLEHHERSARRRPGGAFAPIAGFAAAGLLVTLTSFAHPTIANASPVSVGSTIASTTTLSDTGLPSTAEAKAVDALFAGTAEQADERADLATSQGTATIAAAKGQVDVSALVASVASLANHQYLDTTTVQTLTTAALAQTTAVQNQKAALDKAAAEAAAAAQAAAEAAAAQAAADAAAAAQAAADRLAASTTPDGARAAAADIASADYGWGSDQFQCLDSLWTKESGWNYQAENASSGAFGIPQALPGSKMSTIADDWATNPVTQITWGLAYIAAGYGTPCSAWSHSQSVNWY
ncbi:phospholipase [Herbiconiux liangxiaofengii]|uniref:aggregation-promoting factor C-terminal-like domain-containing protein n=1 Tax=Herbiconiux liangxiaofengii TaxID=3342795 RepID=UPI0035BB3C46